MHLDDEERAQKVVLKVLITEEDTALNGWHAAKRELEVLVRLRAAALEEYNAEAERKEQAELDEWAVLRRAA
jgi:flagellar biosynthesis chaperone FliJ